MTKAGIMKTVSLKGKEKFLRLGVERYTALFDIAKKNDRDMTKQLDFYYIKWGFESRLKRSNLDGRYFGYYIKWGFESRLKLQIKC